MHGGDWVMSSSMSIVFNQMLRDELWWIDRIRIAEVMHARDGLCVHGKLGSSSCGRPAKPDREAGPRSRVPVVGLDWKGGLR